MSDTAEQPKAKRERKAKETAITVVSEPEVRLGSLSIANPAELVTRATEIATSLADIINKQKLFSIIRNKKTGESLKYVRCEGWTTCGALLGVIPVEDYCRRLESGKGYEAKINLIRTRDGGLVGSASAECTTDEFLWKSRDSHSLRSMALTRATGKAFRLSFSWIIKLAGFEPTPAEEMMAEENAPIEAQAVSEEVERQKAGKMPMEAPNAQQRANGRVTTLFYTVPERHNGNVAEWQNIDAYISSNQDKEDTIRMIFTAEGAKRNKDGGVLVQMGKMPNLLEKLVGDNGIDVHKLEAAQ